MNIDELGDGEFLNELARQIKPKDDADQVIISSELAEIISARLLRIAEPIVGRGPLQVR